MVNDNLIPSSSSTPPTQGFTDPASSPPLQNPSLDPSSTIDPTNPSPNPNPPPNPNPAPPPIPSTLQTQEPVSPPFPIATDIPSSSSEESLVEEDPTSPPPPPPPPEAGEAAKPAKIIEPIFKRFLPIIIGVGAIIIVFLLITKLILPIFKKEKQADLVNLKYWGLWEPENIMAQVIDDYRADHPNVTIEYVRQSHKDYRERLQSALAKNEGPDIFRWHNTWLPMLKADLAPIPDDIFSPGEFDTTFYPIVKQNVFSANRYYGIPLEFDTLSLYINEDILAENPSLKVPTTWDNLRQTAQKLKKQSGNQLTRGGVALGTTSNVDNFSDILGLMILQNGGDPGNPNDDTVTSALKFYTLFSKQDQVWDDTLPHSTYAFATEKVAMIIAPSWRALEVKSLNPQLNFKLYPVPQLPGTNVAWATYWIEGVSKKSLNQPAAFEFLKYLSSQATLQKFYNSASQVRLFGEPYSRQDMASNLQQDPFVGAVLSQALSAQSWPLASRTFDNGLNDKLIKYYEDAINSFNKDEAEKVILDNLSSGVSQVLSQYGLN